MLENKMTVDYYHVAKSRAKLCFLEDDRLPATGFDRIADSSQAMKKGVREKGQVQLGSNEKRFFKPKLFDVCTDFTNVSLEIRARVISRGVIIILR